MLSLSNINITQQTSNQPKKWRNEDVSLSKQRKQVCVCRCVNYKCVFAYLKERQASIARTLNNRANQSSASGLIKR